jgi:hypothetical protein
MTSEVDALIERLRATEDDTDVDYRTATLCTQAADLIAAYREALEGMVDKYTSLVNCGDCGFWDPELEPEVIAARKALGRGEG